jgi:hypothetical protein
LSQFLSHSPPSGTVHQRSPRSCSGRSRTVAACGERCPALLESVLGQPLASSNLLSSATLTCMNIGGWPLTSGLIVSRWAHLWARSHSRRRVPLPISVGRLCLVKGITDEPERRAHAAEACALSSVPAGTIRDLGAGCCCVRPDTRQLTDRITLSDREVRGERAPSRYGRQSQLGGTESMLRREGRSVRLSSSL